jgi:DNA polymerase-3 subunit epsilon
MDLSIPKLSIELQRPLVFFDLESTGTDVVADRIVEMAFVKINPDGSTDVRPAEGAKRMLINPVCLIPAESTAIHGITDEDVAGSHTFEQVAPGLNKWLEGCDLAGYNSNRFDVPMLAEEFHRAGIEFSPAGRSMVDVQTIFHKLEPRTLKAAFGFFCDETLEGAHAALPDVVATVKVFAAQLERYKAYSITDSHGETVGPLPQDVLGIASFGRQNRWADLGGKFVYDEEDRLVFNFGKHRGKLLQDVLDAEPGYYGWMMNGNFPATTKMVLKAAASARKQAQ